MPTEMNVRTTPSRRAMRIALIKLRRAPLRSTRPSDTAAVDVARGIVTAGARVRVLEVDVALQCRCRLYRYASVGSSSDVPGRLWVGGHQSARPLRRLRPSAVGTRSAEDRGSA